MTTKSETSTEASQQTTKGLVSPEADGESSSAASIDQSLDREDSPVTEGNDPVDTSDAADGAESEVEDDAGLLPDGLAGDAENDAAPAGEPSPEDTAASSPGTEAIGREAAGAGAGEMRLILASLEEAVARAGDSGAKIDGIAADLGVVTEQLNSIFCKNEMVSSEIESLRADNHSKSVLSKTFLLIASVAVVALVVFQVYTFTELVSTQRQLNQSGRTVLENVAALNKKMAEYDKNLTKALEASAPKEPARQAAPETVSVPSEKDGHNEAARTAIPVQERVNRLRNGLPERRLIRKETGDWFVLNNKKAEECIVDGGVIEVLNCAFRKSGRPLTTSLTAPPHNALCVLKPDGKGGTEVVMTKDFVQ
jgi:hypothetical protein